MFVNHSVTLKAVNLAGNKPIKHEPLNTSPILAGLFGAGGEGWADSVHLHNFAPTEAMTTRLRE